MEKKIGEKRHGRGKRPNFNGYVKISLLFYHFNFHLCHHSLFEFFE